MSATHSCPQGHTWHEQEDAASPGQGHDCPVCRAESASSLGSIQDTWQPAGSSALPPPPRGSAAPAPRAPQEASGEELPVIPGYEVLAELGRGGMGVVYQARQISLNRVVALKMILPGVPLGTQELLRFRTEAEAVARLQHPNIVQVHEVGDHKHRPFLCLEFVGGGSLARCLAGQPQPFDAAARLTETLARAVQFAHSHGIVHRDLKPANILLEVADNLGNGPDSPPESWIIESAVPKLTDFGLAKRLDADSGQTRTGIAVGTPTYMAPEQALGQVKSHGPGVDVYALGAILYEILTGRPPFLGASSVETMQQIVTDEPVSPRRLQPRLPRDLETICLKCLQKEPLKRYSSAEALASDLHRFLNSEPIHARPISVWGRSVKWAKRRPTVAALALLSAAAVFGLVIGGMKYTSDLENALKDTKKATSEKDAALSQKNATVVDLHASLGLVAGQQGNAAQAVLWFANAAVLAHDDKDQQYANLIRLGAWSRMLPLPVLAVPHPDCYVRDLCFHSSSTYLMIHTIPAAKAREKMGQVSIWDLRNASAWPVLEESAQISAAAWNPSGDRLAIGTYDGKVKILSFPSGQQLTEVAGSGAITALGWDQAGKLLAIGGRSVRVWDFARSEFATPEVPHPAAVRYAVFNAAGTRLATAAADGSCRLFAVPSTSVAPLFDPVPQVGIYARKEVPSCPIFLDNDRGLLTLTGKSEAVWRDAETGKALRTIPSPNSTLQSVVLSPDGRHFAACSFCNVELWDVEKRRVLWRSPLHENTVHAVAFTPDGERLYSSSGDRKIRLVRRRDGIAEGASYVQLQEVLYLVAAPDGSCYASAQADGLVRVWRPPIDRREAYALKPDCTETFISLSADGRHALPCGSHMESGLLSTRVFDVGSGQPAGPEIRVGGIFNGGAFAPDGMQIMTLSSPVASKKERDWVKSRPNQRPGFIHFWDWKTARQTHAPLQTPSEPFGVAYRPDGSLAVVVCAGGQILFIDPRMGKQIGQGTHRGLAANMLVHDWVRFSADGRSFVTWGVGHEAIVWSADELRPRLATLRHDGPCTNARFSANGKWLATSSLDHTARIWNLETGELAAPFLDHPDWVFSVCFAGNDETVITACRDQQARIWDWRKRVVLRSLEHQEEVFDVNVVPGGRWPLTASRDGTAQVWDLQTGKPVLPPFPLEAFGHQITATPDGAWAVIGGRSKATQIQSLGDLREPAAWALKPDAIRQLGEVLSGQRIDGGKPTQLTPSEWFERWTGLRQSNPQFSGLTWSVADEQGWRRRQVASCIRTKQYGAALLHLDWLIARQPSDVELYLLRGRANHGANYVSQALVDFSKAIELSPADPSGRRRRGAVNLELGRLEEALDDFTRALEGGANDAQVWFDRALVLSRMKKWDAALADYTKVIELKPESWGAWHNRGGVNAQLGKIDPAIADFTKAIELKPDAWQPWSARSEMYFRKGEFAKASADVAKAATLQLK